jgi:hypothetical protein
VPAPPAAEEEMNVPQEASDENQQMNAHAAVEPMSADEGEPSESVEATASDGDSDAGENERHFVAVRDLSSNDDVNS